MNFLRSRVCFDMRRYSHFIRYDTKWLRNTKKRFYLWKFRIRQETILLGKTDSLLRNFSFTKWKYKTRLVSRDVNMDNDIYMKCSNDQRKPIIIFNGPTKMTELFPVYKPQKTFYVSIYMDLTLNNNTESF